MSNFSDLKEGLEPLQPFARMLGKKVAILTGLWVVVYFGTQWLSDGPLALLGPILGSILGVGIGWTLAQDAVETAGFSGFNLWVILVLAGWGPVWIVEWTLGAIMHAAAGWQGTFGRWMLLMATTVMILASAVWRASADD